MKNYEVMIGNNRGLNVLVQSHAFALGYSWEIQFEIPVFLDAKRLYLTHNGFIYRTITDKKTMVYEVVKANDFLKLTMCDVKTCDCPCHKPVE